MSRPVTSVEPTIKDNFKTNLRQSNIDKVDLLFDIDNSASMGDKEAFLSQAVPDFLNRLLAPQCVDELGKRELGSDGKILTSDANGVCAQGEPEFKPVHDLHIGVVTSSLGARGGNIAGCEDSGGAGHSNDRGELITRGSKGPVADVSTSNFLAWFPTDVDANKGKAPTPGTTPIGNGDALRADFADLVVGVGQDGCGIESQLESWYRFLVQPDPWDHIDTSSGKAVLVGVDETIIKQRHDFLRPDSLVAVIDLTDENDSEIDSRSVDGTAWKFLYQNDPNKPTLAFHPPRGTSVCATNAADPACTSCAFGGSGDPSCKINGGVYSESDKADWGFDLNLRHVHPKQKYGLDPQFPIDRYFDGLTKTSVPDRNGEYPPGAGSYVGQANCTSPLYAASLPADASDSSALCTMPLGVRTPDLVFFGIIGGVPNQLLHYDPNDPASINLSATDWTKILGADPERYDYSGIDPHMIESFEPRVPGSTGYPASVASHTDYDGVTETDVQAATGANDADPWNGREWITDSPGASTKSMPFNVDREYACTFKIPTRHCAGATGAAQQACDCPTSADASTLPPGSIPPVCDPNAITDQVAAKVYPTPRELLLAKKMSQQKGGKQNQGIAASLCPIHVEDNATGDDPLYGYRPAVAAIVERLKNALAAQCLPTALTPDTNGTVPCLILEALPAGSTCDAGHGLTPADPKQAANYLAELEASAGGADSGADLSGYVVCKVGQILGGDLDSNGSCTGSSKAGWCYVTGDAAGACAQAIKFSQTGSPLAGARVSLQCIQQTSDAPGGDGG